MENNKKGKGLNISAKSFISAIVVIFALMVISYVLTFVIPGGEYIRLEDGTINSDIPFHNVEGGIPFWKWILSPFLVLGSADGTTLIAILFFLLIIGGIFEAVGRCGLMKYMLDSLTMRFSKRRYVLMAVVIFFFMALGSLIGSFEECVPLVPLVTALAIGLGWDAITGLGMSILAVGCGFAAGVFNPFTVGVAQKLVGLSVFSGAWLRIIAFIFIYLLVLLFVRLHAKRVERPVDVNGYKANFVYDKKLKTGMFLFAVILGIGIAIVLSSSFISALQDYTMIIVAVMFLVAGVAASFASGMKAGEFFKAMGKGVVGMLPAVLMILMASSIKYTLTEAKVLDTILDAAIGVTANMPRWTIILFVYLIALVMNFFIASGSAKAFMLMPLLVPLAAVFDIPAQLCVVAYAFGDGFSNVFYPTNPVLLISLGLADTSYTKWFKWTWKFQLFNLVLTSAILLFGLAVGYC